jgi:hypothetical protein
MVLVNGGYAVRRSWQLVWWGWVPEVGIRCKSRDSLTAVQNEVACRGLLGRRGEISFVDGGYAARRSWQLVWRGWVPEVGIRCKSRDFLTAVQSEVACQGLPG